MSEAYALKRLLSCFDIKGWPHITVALKVKGKRGWVSGAVDDETREAIRYAEKVLEERVGDNNRN